MKIVNKKISAEREAQALGDSKKSGFAVAFGDKSLFSTLQINIALEGSGKEFRFEIAKEFLPNNKTNTTRFYLKRGEDCSQIRWCSKVAENMGLV